MKLKAFKKSFGKCVLTLSDILYFSINKKAVVVPSFPESSAYVYFKCYYVKITFSIKSGFKPRVFVLLVCLLLRQMLWSQCQ